MIAVVGVYEKHSPLTPWKIEVLSNLHDKLEAEAKSENEDLT